MILKVDHPDLGEFPMPGIVVLGLVAKWAGVNIFTLLKYLKDELLLAFSTSSSETVLPRVMEKLEKMGCPKAIVSFVVPIGYTFNLDGSVLYQAIAALFLLIWISSRIHI